MPDPPTGQTNRAKPGHRQQHNPQDGPHDDPQDHDPATRYWRLRTRLEWAKLAIWTILQIIWETLLRRT